MNVHSARVSPSSKIDRLLARAERQFKKLLKTAGTEAVPLTDLLDLVNEVSEQLLPAENGGDSRVSRVFTPRSFRHYQTLGCIDPPERDGKQAVYGVRHFTQALLVRKLLSERVPAERIVGVMAGRSTEETKGMLFGGIEMVARRSGGDERSGVPENWRRVVVVPGVELHLRDDLPKPKAGELKELLAALETALRRGIG